MKLSWTCKISGEETEVWQRLRNSQYTKTKGSSRLLTLPALIRDGLQSEVGANAEARTTKFQRLRRAKARLICSPRTLGSALRYRLRLNCDNLPATPGPEQTHTTGKMTKRTKSTSILPPHLVVRNCCLEALPPASFVPQEHTADNLFRGRNYR